MKGSGGNGTFGFGGGYTSIVSKIFDVLMLGLMWLVFCVPIVTIGASSAALYYAIVKSVKNDDGYASTMFFRSFRTNLKQGAILTIIVGVLLYLMGLNVGILLEKATGLFGIIMMGFYIAVAVYIVLMAVYMFAALSRFVMGVGWFIRVGIYMVARYFLTSIMIAVILVSAGAIVWRIPLLILIVPGPVAFLISEFMERVLEKHTPKAGQGTEAAETGEPEFAEPAEAGERDFAEPAEADEPDFAEPAEADERDFAEPAEAGEPDFAEPAETGEPAKPESGEDTDTK